MNEQLQDLFKRFFDGTATAAEQQLLMQYVLESGDTELEVVMRARWDALQHEVVAAPDGSHVLAAILEKPVRHKAVRMRWYWAAAAVLVLAIGVGGYFRLQLPKAPDTGVSATGSVVLVLDDGTVVTLDSNGHQTLKQGSAVIQQKGGQLVYDETGRSAEVKYNTLKTPAGKQFRLTLPDGSMVWLNAASSIRFPTVFEGSDRRVELSGEAFFDITQNTLQPFKVNINNQAEVAVLGTSFNIYAYEDGSAIKTTLVTGAVSMAAGSGSAVVLRPGQQAQADEASNVRLMKTVDIDQVLAWRNGLFNFDHADLQSVMNEISRWYGVTVRYEGDIPSRTFRGKIKRDLSLSQVLEVLQDVNVKFRMDENTIVVYK